MKGELITKGVIERKAEKYKTTWKNTSGGRWHLSSHLLRCVQLGACGETGRRWDQYCSGRGEEVEAARQQDTHARKRYWEARPWEGFKNMHWRALCWGGGGVVDLAEASRMG